MNAHAIVYREQKYRNIARTISGIVGILLLVLLFMKIFTYPDPPPGQAGLLVSFGEPDIGQGEEVSAPPPMAEEETKEEEAAEAEPEEVTEPEVSEPEVSEPEPEPTPKDVIADQKSKERALKKAKEERERKKKNEEAKKKKAEEDAKKKADAEKKRKADEARKKKEAAEAAKKAEADKLKGEIGGLFGQSGSGKGNTGKPGNQGDPNGDPNASNLEGISTGTGMVGGGLGNRGGKGPKISDSSQETGRVVVKVCVDSKGKVVSAKYTQGGSTTSSSRLIRVAEANAKKWSFRNGELDKQCGTITYDFKVK